MMRTAAVIQNSIVRIEWCKSNELIYAKYRMITNCFRELFVMVLIWQCGFDLEIWRAYTYVAFRS